MDVHKRSRQRRAGLAFLAALATVAATAATVALPATKAQAVNRPFKFNGVSAAQFGDRDLVVASGFDNAGTNHVFFKTGRGGSTPSWGNDEWKIVPGGGQTGLAPAISAKTADGSNYVFVVGGDQQLWYQQAFGSSTGPVWVDRWQKAPGGDLSFGLRTNISVHYNEKLKEVFVTGMNVDKKPVVKRLNTFTQAWTAWKTLSTPAPLLADGVAGSRPGVAVTSVDGKVAYAVVDSTKQVWVGEEKSFGVVGWRSVFGPGSTEMTPTFALSPSNVLTLFVHGVGSPTRLFYKSMSNPALVGVTNASTWTTPFAEVPGGGVFRKDAWGDHVSVSTASPGVLHLYGMGTDGLPWSNAIASTGAATLGMTFADGYTGWQKVPTKLDSAPTPPPPPPPPTTPPTPPPTTPPPPKKADLLWVGEPSKDSNGKVTMKLKNAGNAAAGSFVVSLFFNNVNVGNISYNGLAVGATDDVTFETKDLLPGAHNILINADSFSSVAESNEGNNEFHFIFTK